MKIKTKNLITVSLVTSIFSIFCLAYAQDAATQAPYKPQVSDKANIFDGLNITAEQQEKIKIHKEENKVKINGLREQMKTKREGLKTEMKSPNMDTAKVQSLASDIKNLIGQLVDLNIDGVIFLKQTLTPEQFSKFQIIVGEKLSNGTGDNPREKLKERIKEKRMQSKPKMGSQNNPEESNADLSDQL
jgi:Spy/CpxP family protein refolding chaperone